MLRSIKSSSGSIGKRSESRCTSGAMSGGELHRIARAAKFVQRSWIGKEKVWGRYDGHFSSSTCSSHPSTLLFL